MYVYMSVCIYWVEKSVECYVLSEENGSKMQVQFTRLWEKGATHRTGHISQHSAFSSHSSMLCCHLTILFLVLQIIGSHLACSCTLRFGQPFPHPPFPPPASLHCLLELSCHNLLFYLHKGRRQNGFTTLLRCVLCGLFLVWFLTVVDVCFRKPRPKLVFCWEGVNE